jgi:hypothetical protein
VRRSHTEYLVAHTVWFSFSFAVLVTLNASLRLLPERFVGEGVPISFVVKLERILRLMAARGTLVNVLLAVGCDVLLSLDGGGKRCMFAGCEKGTQRNGKCFSHGGGHKCQAPQCAATIRRGVFCNLHDGKLRAVAVPK